MCLRGYSRRGPVIEMTGLRAVEIDLNGFTLYGPTGGGAAIQANEVINLTVRNGTLWAQSMRAASHLLPRTRASRLAGSFCE